MKRTFKYALVSVLALGVVLPAIAQDQFPDVPENHWAYEALARLKKDGLLVGYPDGKYRGARPATRYELAVAIHAAYVNLKGVTDGLQSQIRALEDAIKNIKPAEAGKYDGPSKEEFNALKDAVDALKNDLASFKGYGDDIAALKKAADTFQKELSSLGVDVEALKKDLSDLSARVKALEGKKASSIDISGDATLWLGASHGSSAGAFGLSQDGRLEGTTNPAAGAGVPTASLLRDLSVIHELGFNFKGTGGEGVDWNTTLVVGNALGSAADYTHGGFGDQAGALNDTGSGYTHGVSTVYIQNAEVKFNSKLVGVGFSATAGRFGYKVSPLIFQRPDYTNYFSSSRWDDGKYTVEGVNLGFKLGAGKLSVIAGTTSSAEATNGLVFQNLKGGNTGFADNGIAVNKIAGATYGTHIGGKGTLNLAYLLLDGDNAANFNGVAGAYDRINVWGADFGWKLGEHTGISADYARSDKSLGSTSIAGGKTDDAAWDAMFHTAKGAYMLGAGYREVGANYVAPGDWGRVGVRNNQTNTKSWLGHISRKFSNKLSLSVRGQFDSALNTSGAYDATDFGAGANGKTKADTYGIDLKYALRNDFTFHFGYEDTKYTNLVTAVNPASEYRWLTFGVHHDLTETSKLVIQYQTSDVKNEFQAGSPGGAGAKVRGGFLTTQLSIKF